MPPSSGPNALEISCHAVRAKLDAGDPFLLLDCRERDEYQFVHIAEAQLLPMSELRARVPELDEHRQREIVVYCHHSMRSLQVTQWLAQQGFEQVRSMAGGIDAWSTAIDPSLPRY